MAWASWSERTVAEAGGVAYVAPEPEPHDARIWFFTRKGGVSEPPYDTLNISALVGDDRDDVHENLSRIRIAMGDRPSAWVTRCFALCPSSGRSLSRSCSQMT